MNLKRGDIIRVKNQKWFSVILNYNTRSDELYYTPVSLPKRINNMYKQSHHTYRFGIKYEFCIKVHHLKLQSSDDITLYKHKYLIQLLDAGFFNIKDIYMLFTTSERLKNYKCLDPEVTYTNLLEFNVSCNTYRRQRRMYCDKCSKYISDLYNATNVLICRYCGYANPAVMI